jgi:hypothetical protein
MMCCQSYFFPEFAANYVFFPDMLSVKFFPKMCCQLCFFPECATNHVFATAFAATFWEEKMISSTFWGKT